MSLERGVFGRAARGASGDRVLVLLELAGGNDGLATLVPFEDDLYWKARPTIAHEKSELRRLAGHDLCALHPSLARTAERFAKGQVALLQNVGYATPNLSHFVSRDIWSSASLSAELPQAGWLGSWRDVELARDGDPLAMLEVGSCGVPYSLRSRVALAPAVESLESYGFAGGAARAGPDAGERRLACLHALHASHADEPMLDFVQANFELAQRTSAILRTTLTPKSNAPYPGSRLAQELKMIAGVIEHERPTRVFHVLISGFDTHVHQRRDQDRLLVIVDNAVEAFLADLEARGLHDRVCVLTTSEFGRRVHESGLGDDAGTDHGAASVQMLWGAKVRGGVFGEQPDLEHLDRDGNLNAQIDFRRVYASVIEQWLGGDATAALGAEYETLPLFEARGA